MSDKDSETFAAWWMLFWRRCWFIFYLGGWAYFGGRVVGESGKGGAAQLQIMLMLVILITLAILARFADSYMFRLKQRRDERRRQSGEAEDPDAVDYNRGDYHVGLMLGCQVSGLLLFLFGTAICQRFSGAPIFRCLAGVFPVLWLYRDCVRRILASRFSPAVELTYP